MLRRLWVHKSLILVLCQRQYQLRFRQSSLGFAWALVPPLAMLGAGALLFHKVAHIDTGGVPYVLFAFSALVPWTLFANSLSLGISSVVTTPGLITKFSFPRAVLPISMVGTSLIDLAITSALFVVISIAIGAGISLSAAWYPVLLLIELVLICGIVLFGSAINVFARDASLAIPLLVQMWLLVTPVLYPLESVPANLRPWYLINPMTGLVVNFRRILVEGQAPDLGTLLPSIVGAIVIAVIGWSYFAASERLFADVV